MPESLPGSGGAETRLELWLLRHGATAWSPAGRLTGRTDLDLLEEGETEAGNLAPVLARQRFLAVLTRPLRRARKTCERAGLGTGGAALVVLGTGGLSVLGHERSTRTLLRWNVPVAG